MTDIHPCDRFDQSLRNPHPWRQGRKFDNGFLNFLGKNLPKVDMHPRLYAASYILNQEQSQEGLEKINVSWDMYSESLEVATGNSDVVARSTQQIETTPNQQDYWAEVRRRQDGGV